MPELYFPQTKTIELISSLVQGFWIEFDEDNEIVLHFKFEASILTKLINGCNFELIIRNPKLAPRSITLYIFDNIKDPLWITGNNFGTEDIQYLGFDDITLQLIKTEKIRVVYYNHLNLPVFTTILEKENLIKEFEPWILDIYNNNEPLTLVNDGYYVPENVLKGFKIKVQNIDNSKEPKMNFYTPLESLKWEEEILDVNGYNFNDFLDDGKHGFNQEISIKSFLSNIFEANEEFFCSPTKYDENELIDFLICHQNAAILIESKYILSDKKTKLNKALTKAVNQLNHAEKIISTNLDLVINNHNVVEKLKNCDIFIRICLYNDSQSLFGGKTNNIIKSFSKNELPIFISVTVFFQLIGDIKITYGKDFKFNIVQNLIYLYQDYLENEEKILLIREFKLNPKK
ncbi:hypothetical protein [Flavobacterium sp.]|uniref:hypothetical protein n=1 Tax=Flavobacterium sp. TaxID=239 RepID=UPI003D0CC50C